jgi:hypothetical protein
MEVPMSLILCADCGIPFAITKDLQDKLLECHNSFYCPKGHGQNYPQKSDKEILQSKLNQANKSLEYFRQEEKKRLDEVIKKLEKRKLQRKAKVGK